jgi:hypothetical protein
MQQQHVTGRVAAVCIAVLQPIQTISLQHQHAYKTQAHYCQATLSSIHIAVLHLACSVIRQQCKHHLHSTVARCNNNNILAML